MSAHDIVNSDQFDAWNGPEGHAWARQRSDADGLEDVVVSSAAIEPGSRVLAVGCGAGELTRLAASLTPGGAAVGIDLSEPLLAEARRRSQGLANIDFVHGDAQVAAFDDPFDRVVSHFGVMFFGEPAAAFSNLRHATRSGGSLTAVVPGPMEECRWYTDPLAAVLGRPPTEESEPSAMFTLADPAGAAALLESSGWSSGTVTRVEAALRFGATLEAAVDFFAASGPMRAVLQRPTGPGESEVRRRLGERLARWEQADGVRLPGLHWLVRAVHEPTRAAGG